MPEPQGCSSGIPSMRPRWSIAGAKASLFLTGSGALVQHRCSHGRSGDVRCSQPGPLWALQQFLVYSAPPAGKLCVIPQHPGGWTKPPARECDVWLGSGAQSQSVGSSWIRHCWPAAASVLNGFFRAQRHYCWAERAVAQEEERRYLY